MDVNNVHESENGKSKFVVDVNTFLNAEIVKEVKRIKNTNSDVVIVAPNQHKEIGTFSLTNPYKLKDGMQLFEASIKVNVRRKTNLTKPKKKRKNR